MPYYLKLSALAVTVLGFALALELNLTTQNLKLFFKPIQILWPSWMFSIMHRLPPLMNLLASQKSASLLLDLIWLENVLSKSISQFQMKTSTLVSNRKGLVMLYFSFLITLTLSLIMLSFHE